MNNNSEMFVSATSTSAVDDDDGWSWLHPQPVAPASASHMAPTEIIFVGLNESREFIQHYNNVSGSTLFHVENLFSSSTTTPLINITPEGSTSEGCSEDTKFFLFNEVERAALLTGGSVISVIAIVLNCLVLACFAQYATLHTPSNIYVVHLTICDLFVGLNSLPSRILIDFEGCWPLPLLCCRISQVLHWITVQQSAFCMVLIAYDRYLMLRLGTAYAQRETNVVVWRRVMLFWLINVLIWTPLNLLHLFTHKSASSPGKCNTEFLSNGYVAMPTFVWANFVTPAMLLTLYSLVFAALRQRTANQLQHNDSSGSSASPAAGVTSATVMLLSPYDKAANGKQPKPQRSPSTTLSANNNNNNDHHHGTGGGRQDSVVELRTTTGAAAQAGAGGGNARVERLLARQQKALRSMIVLTAVFLLTWLPEGILGITYKAYCSLWRCYGEDVDPHVFQVYYGFVKATSLADYLLLSNAALNPALYALAFPSIREAMMRLTLPAPLHKRWVAAQQQRERQKRASRRHSKQQAGATAQQQQPHTELVTLSPEVIMPSRHQSIRSKQQHEEAAAAIAMANRPPTTRVVDGSANNNNEEDESEEASVRVLLRGGGGDGSGSVQNKL